jgi:hypothetical protein
MTTTPTTWRNSRKKMQLDEQLAQTDQQAGQ